MYNNRQPWITHASIQNGSAVADFGRARIYRECFRKPVIYDEVCYEGNHTHRWGRLSGEEMTHRCWQGFIAGTYVGIANRGGRASRGIHHGWRGRRA